MKQKSWLNQQTHVMGNMLGKQGTIAGQVFGMHAESLPPRVDIQNTGTLIWGGRNDDINCVVEVSAMLVQQYILNMVCDGFYIEKKKVSGLGPKAKLRMLKFDEMSRSFLLGFHDPAIEDELPEGCPPVKLTIGWQDGIEPTTDELLASEAGRVKRAGKAR